MEFLQVFIAVTGIAGQMLVARRDVRGFMIWIASNAALIAVSLNQGLYVMAALYMFYSAMCVYSIRSWRKSDAPAVQPAVQPTVQPAPQPAE